MNIPYTTPVTIRPRKDGDSRSEKDPMFAAFDLDVKTLRPGNEQAALRDFYVGLIESQLPDNRTTEEKQATGEYPVINRYSAIGDPFLPDGGAKELSVQERAELATRRHYELWILTHPTINHAYRRIVAERPYQYIPAGDKRSAVLDDATAKGNVLTWNDLGLRVTPMDEERDPVLSATETIGRGGLFTWLTPNLLTFPIMESPMPHTTSAESIETLNIAGAAALIPFDGRWNNVENQLAMAQRVQELLHSDPVLEGHPDRDFLIERAQRLMGLTLKSDPQDAVARVKRFRDEGIPLSLVRIYNARGNIKAMKATVEALRREFGESLNIIAGQAVNAAHAKTLEAAGASAVETGLFEGSICKSGPVSGTVADNVNAAYQMINLGLKIPVIAEAVSKPTIAFALGVPVLSMSKGINGGTYEQPPVGWIWNTNEGPVKPYSGEASEEMKHEGRKLDMLGNPMFVEGVTGYLPQDRLLPTVTSRMWQWAQDFATMLIFTQHTTLRDLVSDRQPALVHLSEQATASLKPHHPTQRRLN